MERNKEKIRLVVDTNIILSALLKDKTFTAKLLNNKTEEFLKELAPCIERGELEARVEEAARVARGMGMSGKSVFLPSKFI